MVNPIIPSSIHPSIFPAAAPNNVVVVVVVVVVRVNIYYCSTAVSFVTSNITTNHGKTMTITAERYRLTDRSLPCYCCYCAMCGHRKLRLPRRGVGRHGGQDGHHRSLVSYRYTIIILQSAAVAVVTNEYAE